MIHWSLIFPIAICCHRLRLSVGYFTYLKITHVFFQWMFFNLIKEKNRLTQEIIRLLSNVFNWVKENNRLRKELSRLLSKGMSNIYLKVTIDTFLELRFSGFKRFVTRSVLGSINSHRYHWILKFFVAT